MSNLGHVRRIKAGHGAQVGRVLQGTIWYDYPAVSLTVDCKTTWYSVHKLVARAFIGPCPKGKEVNHKDLNKLNPRADNLEYLTRPQNAIHAHRNGCISKRTLNRALQKRKQTMRLRYPLGLTFLKGRENGKKSAKVVSRTRKLLIEKGLLGPKWVDGKYVGMCRIFNKLTGGLNG